MKLDLKMMILALSLAASTFVNTSYANPANLNDGLYDCTQLHEELRLRFNVGSAQDLSAPVGTKCETSKSAIFERVSDDNFGNAWKGPDGLIWGMSHASSFSQQKAIEICKSLGGRLASKSEFERNEANGIREALDYLNNSNAFWTSTIMSPYTLYAFVYDGYVGGTTYVKRSYPESVQCVK